MNESSAGPLPLTILSEEEAMFFDMANDFAKTEIQPLVEEMDREDHVNEDLLTKLFENGFMALYPGGIRRGGRLLFHEHPGYPGNFPDRCRSGRHR